MTDKLSRRKFLKIAATAAASAVVVSVPGALGLYSKASAGAPNRAAAAYSATWASVDTHPAAPEWFQDAKFGMYWHWGVYSVPAYSNEWYPRNMYISGSGEYNHHLSVFGDPYSNWPYHNFINGANNKAGQFQKFAPKLTSAGGNFDPTAWAQFCFDSGCKFAGPVAEHHDGFSDWDSSVNEWNAVGKGPLLNLGSQFATAIRAKGMKFLMSMHHAYHFTGFYDHVPAQSDSSLKKLYGQLGATAENQLWYDKLKEIIDKFQPDIIWHDFNLTQVTEAQRLNYLSYYFNQASSWGKEVVTTHKDGMHTASSVYDYERGGPAGLTTPYWLTDDAISSSSWCYTTGIGYYSKEAMMHSLIDRVSKGGNMLLNISPMWDGSIPQAQKDVCLAMGDWLKKFGEAIYSTRTWTSFGEGPTSMGGGSFTTPRVGTKTDIRFTRNKANTVLYAIVMGWPGNGANLAITTLKSGNINLSGLTGVQLFGATAGSWINVGYSQNSTALNVTMPSSQPYTAMAYALKLTFSGQIGGSGGPTATPVPGVTEAETYNSQSGIATETCGEGGLDVCNIENGDWIAFNNFNFSSNPTGFQARVASATSGGNIEIRLDSSTGTLVGTCAVAGTGGWQTYTTKTCSVSGATGTHTLYLKFTGGSGYLFNVNWFQFTGGGSGPTNTPGPTPTRTNTPVPTITPTPGGFPVPGAYYRIINRNSGKCLDVSGNGTGDGVNVDQWTSNGGQNQQWSFVAQTGGYYEIIARNSGKALEVGGNSTADGGNVQQWTWIGANSQQWSLVNLGSGYYEIVNRNSGKVLDVVGNGTADGVNVDQWTWNSGNNQQWQIIP
jgi:alpha-L-fucosidase